MNPPYEAGVLTILLDLVQKGYVYREFRPINWCCSCRTALAEAEIEYRRALDQALWMYFDGGPALAQRCGLPTESPCSLLVWGTGVWSVPGSVAVGARPESVYGAFAFTDRNGNHRVAIILESLAPAALEAIGATQTSQLATVEGTRLEGLTVAHP